ncbi:MAG TPA: hypothetical protein VLQ47_07290 [Rhodoferax sp.]|nr:hypothetical protein [Rhodoferax sp.]
MVPSAWAISRTFNETNFIGMVKLDSDASRWNGLEGTDTCRMFVAINSVSFGDVYFGNGVASPGTTFGGAVRYESGIPNNQNIVLIFIEINFDLV